MSNILKKTFYIGIMALASIFSGCEPENIDSEYKNGVKDINNPREGKEISFYGETITVSFMTNSAWDAEMECDGDVWARVSSKRNDDVAGKGSVRIIFDRNKEQSKRTSRLYVTVAGCERTLIAEFTQGFNDAEELSQYLNTKMHERLLKDYLWRDEYKKLSDEGKVEMDIIYEDFLNTNLVKLGNANIEDGGIYRDYSSLRGQRYIYSYIAEDLGSRPATAPAAGPQTKASSSYGLGLGVTMASAYANDGTRCLIVGYVYDGSPAAKAGLKRGDLILAVNGNKLVQSNYLDYQYELYYNPSGTYTLEYGRYKDGINLDVAVTTATCASYPYNPVLSALIWGSESDPNVRVGYLVLESFDSDTGARDMLKNYLEQFKNNNISDLILDLRFNPGGSVPLCRYLMSSIVGPSHYDDIFEKLTFVDGSEEVWSFGYGSKNNPDNLGQGPDLGLERLYVICSENTGSASEMVINSLKGIDFPVTTLGSRTEGKNVGMVVETLNYNGRYFEFAPITFRACNAKDFGDYANGFAVDKEVNNQNASYDDDKDEFFPYGTADWEIAYFADSSVAWAYSLITTGKDLEFDTQPVATKAMAGITFRPLENVPVTPRFGRYGSLVYPSEQE